MMRSIQISAKKGAETSVYLASAPELEGVTGKCFYKLEEAEAALISYDQETQRRLWDTTLESLGLTD